jgi:hypothetical protein
MSYHRVHNPPITLSVPYPHGNRAIINRAHSSQLNIYIILPTAAQTPTSCKLLLVLPNRDWDNHALDLQSHLSTCFEVAGQILYIDRDINW